MWFVWSYFQVKILLPVLEFLQITVIAITSLLIAQNYPENANVLDNQSFDFVIVGGGSAGCVVANRLTEVGNWSVLIIEAGDDPPYITEIPGVSVLLGSTFPDWDYYTSNDGYSGQALRLQKVHTIQGKGLGGSSNVNYMYYIRGNENDYQDWVERGNQGWDWKNVTKYFQKSKRNAMAKTGSNSSGYLGVSQPLWEQETKEYFEALKEIGHDILVDTNGFNQLGYSVPSFTIDSHRRQSSSVAYIKPIMKRPNLHILKKTVATKIILNENKKAIGVEVQDNGVKKSIFAKKEIIISAGSLNTPKLLMLSGIGPKEHLEDVGIETHVDVPNVGGNLQDHMLAPVIISTRNDSTFFIDNFKAFTNTDKFPVATVMGFVALDRKQTFPDYQVTAFPLGSGSLLPPLICSQVFQWNDEICIAAANSNDRNILFALISFLHPKSRGTIRLKSKNFDDEPIINAGYLSNDDDLKKFAKSIKDFTRITSTTYFKNINSEVVDLNVKACKNIEFGSQKYWECYVLNLVASQFHYSGTCAMGPEGQGVVDERLRFRSVKGLRVVDTSIMPTIVSGNTYAPVVMIAEKASDMIKQDNGVCVPNNQV